MLADLVSIGADCVEQAFRADVDPLATLAAGTRAVVQTRSLHTHSAFDRSRTYTDLSIPLTGPLHLAGVHAGDRIRIDIHAVDIASRGAMVTLPGRGGFGTPLDASGRSLRIGDGVVAFSAGIEIPVRPMIGKLGVAVPGDPPDGSTVGPHGGNIDCKDLGVGAAVYFTAQVDGALLYVGDLHACQGDGESSLTGVEVEGAVTLSWQPAPDATAGSPRPIVLTADGRVLTIGDGDTLDDAVRHALDDMLALIVHVHGWTREKAAMFLSIAADVGICQVVNPRKSAKVAVSARYLAGMQWLNTEGEPHA